MKNYALWLFPALAMSTALLSSPGQADPSICSRLSPEKQAAFSQLLSSLHPYACCDATFKSCLQKPHPSPLVLRLAKDICRMFRAGKNPKDIRSALMLRARSALSFSKPVEISTKSNMMAGNADAAVTVVVYACTRCPFCKELVPTLHHEVTTGSLQGDVRLFLKPFPIKNHPGSIEGGLGLMAASELNHFWPYVLRLFSNFDSFKVDKLSIWASDTGMDPNAFDTVFKNPATRQSLVEIKREGLRNQVLSTPALFINGQKYLYEMSADAILDVLAEIVDDRKKVSCNP